MKSYWIRMGPKFNMTNVFIKKIEICPQIPRHTGHTRHAEME